MHTVIARLSLALLVAGCSSDPHDTSSGHASTSEDQGSTAHASDASTTHEHASTGEPTTGETGHEHASETGHEHASETGHEHASETGDPGTPAQAYCECMVVYCHDDYHGTWGEDHEMSEALCEAEAAGLPSVGMPAMSGNSLECRSYHCELAKTDPGACASAIGGGSCA